MSRLAPALLALLLLATPAAAQRPGEYAVEGVNPDGSAYRGRLLIAQLGLASWRVLWEVGENSFEGLGMSAGPTFAVAFALDGRPGMAVYNLLPGGAFAGQWTIMGSDAIGTETLTPR